MTRMWGVDPKIMCHNHLLGEHREMHQVKGTVEKHDHGEAILEGLADANAINTLLIKQRHDDLVEEMERRDWDGHSTPMEDVENKFDGIGELDVEKNLELLLERCEDCRERYNETIE